MTKLSQPPGGQSSTFDIEEDEFDEALGLLDNAIKREETPEEHRNSMRAWKWWIVTMCLVTIYSAILTSSENQQKRLITQNGNFQCPAIEKVPENVQGFEEVFSESYEEVSNSLTKNMTKFLEEFRTRAFDDWGETYEKAKAKKRDWKRKHYVPFLNNGSSIFESACGIGLNMYLTLEILSEEAGIENLTVYGNEYMDASTQKANAIFDEIPPAKSRKGQICTSDSTDLSYIPPNSFDLVFTGYLSPMLDPLHFGMEDIELNYDRYFKLCDAKESDWEEKKLRKIAQQRQQDWFGQWVAEMARIAKPGAPIILESISNPLCEEREEWGGVSKEWWKVVSKNNTYAWDVDPKSLEYGGDQIFDDRYHVFMKKKVADQIRE